MNAEQKKLISAYRGAGMAYSTIAEKLELTKDQVSAYCRRNGLAGRLARTCIPESCCQNCGMPFKQKPGRRKQKFCSPECRQSWWNAHPGMVNRKAFYHFTCPCCGREFTAYGNAGRKYCSHGCYIAARFHHDR